MSHSGLKQSIIDLLLVCAAALLGLPQDAGYELALVRTARHRGRQR